MTVVPAYCRRAAFDAFRRELPEIDRPLGLFRAAASIALHTQPEASVDADAEVVGKLAGAVRMRVRSASDPALAAHLHDVLFEVAGFQGNATDYYNPANSLVTEVLRTRRGNPIALALVYRTVASLVGLRADGINTPGHFLASVTLREGGLEHSIIIDPFHRGAMLNEEETIELISSATGRQEHATPATLAIASPNDWLLRVLRNLQGVYAQRGQQRDLMAMQELQGALE